MARGRYIICSQGGAIDKLSNSASVFDIVERVATGGLPQQPSRPLISLRTTAFFIREAGEEDVPFDFQICIKTGDRERVAAQGVFQFARPGHRLAIDIPLVQPLVDPSVEPIPDFVQIAAKIRPHDSDGDWTSISYEISVQPTEAPARAGQEHA